MNSTLIMYENVFILASIINYIIFKNIRKKKKIILWIIF